MFKNRLLNTVAIPVLSMAVLAEPVGASAIRYGREETHSRQAEEGLIQLAQAVVCSDGSEADDQETCNARDAEAQAQAEAEAQAQAEAEAQAQAEAEAQAQAEAEAQAQAEAEAQAQAEAEAQAQAEAEAQAQAEAEAQAQAEAEAQAQQQQAEAEAEAQRQAEAEAQAQAEAEAQAQAEAEAQAQQQQAEAEAEAQRQAEAQAQAEAEAQAQQQAEQPAEEAPAESVTCADGSTAASEAECPAPAEQQTEEQPAQDQQTTEEPTEEQPAQDQQTTEEPTEEQASPDQTETEQQPVDGQTETPADTATDADQPTDQNAPVDAQTESQPNADGETQPEEATGESEQTPTEEVVVPAVEPPENQPVEEITDNRTEEEKQQIAEDPSQSTETVVLPVDNGAAVLDSDKDADNTGGDTAREQRNQLRAQEDVAPPPQTDADAQANVTQVEPETVKATIAEEGTRLDAVPTFDVPTTVVNNVTNVTNITNNTTNNTVNNTVIQNNVVNQVTEIRVVEQIDNRTVINVGNQIIVRGDDRERLRYDSEETYYEKLPRGRTRETIIREDGSRIVTVYNRYGDIVIRSRISPRGREYVLMYSPEADNERPQVFIDVGLSLPPMRLTVPVQDYIISTSRAPDRDYYDFLGQPPVERVERVYSIDEVKSSARLRDKVRRIDLDTITFPSGSAEVPLAQAKTLRKVADAMNKLLEKDPGEVFLIEGHTDAVGADRANLVLSDQRASTVASLLSEVYGIPPENMSVQGYGERYLKIRTEAAEQQNRRVAIRRVTSLVRPANVSGND
jgi:outer membrane protein OmpA-like peptidoglycan-associated protein